MRVKDAAMKLQRIEYAYEYKYGREYQARAAIKRIVHCYHYKESTCCIASYIEKRITSIVVNISWHNRLQVVGQTKHITKEVLDLS